LEAEKCLKHGGGSEVPALWKSGFGAAKFSVFVVGIFVIYQ
jgi:hypothetical protein